MKLLTIMILLVSASTEDMMRKINIKPQCFTITNAVELAPLTVLLDQYLTSEHDAEDSPHTVKAYRTGLGQFVEHAVVYARKTAKALSFSDITRALVVDYQNARLETGKPSTAAQRVDMVRSFCSWMEKRYGVNSPCDRVPRVRKQEPTFKGLTPAEIGRVSDVAKRSPCPVQRFLPFLLWSTGLRVDEAARLSASHFSDDKLWVLNIFGKGKKWRSAPVIGARSFLPELETYLYWRSSVQTPSKYLLPSTYRGGKGPLSGKTLWRHIKDVCAPAKVPGAHPHMFRHTYAYRFLDERKQAGLDSFRAAAELRAALGHGDINTTLIYLGFRRADFTNPFSERRL